MGLRQAQATSRLGLIDALGGEENHALADDLGIHVLVILAPTARLGVDHRAALGGLTEYGDHFVVGHADLELVVILGAQTVTSDQSEAQGGEQERRA